LGKQQRAIDCWKSVGWWKNFLINLIYTQMHFLVFSFVLFWTKTGQDKKLYVQIFRQTQTKRKLFSDTYCYYINIMCFKLNYDNFFFPALIVEHLKHFSRRWKRSFSSQVAAILNHNWIKMQLIFLENISSSMWWHERRQRLTLFKLRAGEILSTKNLFATQCGCVEVVFFLKNSMRFYKTRVRKLN